MVFSSLFRLRRSLKTCLTEIDELNQTPYGRSKAMVETILKDLAPVHDFTYTSLRYFCAQVVMKALDIQIKSSRTHNAPF